MFNRAAPFVRLLRARRPLSSVAVPATASPSSAPSPSQGPAPSTFRRKYAPPKNVEQNKLYRRHGDAINNLQIESLHDIVEQVEWYDVINTNNLELITNIIRNSTREQFAQLSDWQLATIISAFGSRCQAMPPSKRSALLQEALKALKDNGVTLSVEARTSLFSVRLDNGESPSISEEASEWQRDGLVPSADMIVQLARAYALQGDAKGVIEIINECKASQGSVDGRLVEWMAYAIARQNASDAAFAQIEKLCTPATSLAIWSSVARACAARGDASRIVAALARIPVTARLERTENNLPVLEAFFDLVEGGVENAEEVLLPYLSLSEDGKTLHERHANTLVVARARRAISEGKLVSAARIYALCHESKRNTHVEHLIREGLVKFADQKSVEEVVAMGERLQAIGVVNDYVQMVVTQMPSSRTTVELLKKSIKEGKLEELAKEHPAQRTEWAQAAIKHSKEEADGLGMAAQIMLAVKEPFRIREQTFTDLYKMAGKDPALIHSAMASVPWETRRGLATAAISRLLVDRNALALDEIHQFVTNPVVTSASTYYLLGGLTKLLLAKDDVDQNVQTVAKILSLDFPKSGDEHHSYNGGRTLVEMAKNQRIGLDKLKALVKALQEYPHVSLDRGLMGEAAGDMVKREMSEKLAVLGTLKRKSQAAVRWQSSSLEDLEKELAHIASRADAKPGVLSRLSSVIIAKIADAEPFLIDQGEAWLRRLKDLDTKTYYSAHEAGRRLYSVAMRKATVADEYEAAKRIWAMRPPKTLPPTATTLAFAARCVVHGERELADQVAAALREAAVPIEPAQINTIGDYLDSCSTESIEEVGKWLKATFGLEDRVIMRLNSGQRKKKLADLIKNQRFEDAVEYATAQTTLLGAAFGQFELFAEGIKRNDEKLITSTFSMVEKAHSKMVALVDLAFIMFMEKQAEHGIKLLSNPGVSLSTGKLNFFIKAAIDQQRVDVLHNLFTGLTVNGEKANSRDLNYLLTAIFRLYFSKKDVESMKALSEEVRKSGFTVEEGNAKVIQNYIRQAS